MAENVSDDLLDTNQNTDLLLHSTPKYDIFDGEIDMNSNYTGFLEVIGKSNSSNYFWLKNRF